jgi:hypothetical protein
MWGNILTHIGVHHTSSSITDERNFGHLFICLALAKTALPGQFDLLVSSQSKEKS